MKEYPLAKVYQLLEPGPVVLLTTVNDGLANVMTMSWHTMLEFEPPLVACVVSDANYSFKALRKTGECVIGVPGAHLAKKVVAVGNCSGRTTDKFASIGLTRLAASAVAAPLVAECFANFECRVVDTRMVKQYNLFILEVLQAWAEPHVRRFRTIHHQGYGSFIVDGRTLKLRSRMR